MKHFVRVTLKDGRVIEGELFDVDTVECQSIVDARGDDLLPALAETEEKDTEIS